MSSKKAMKVGEVRVVKKHGRKYYKKKLGKGRFSERLVHPKVNPNPKKGPQRPLPKGTFKGRHFNYGRSHRADKKRFNKREPWEVPMNMRKGVGKAMKALGKGKGWFGESLRHSLARKFGSAPK